MHISIDCDLATVDEFHGGPNRDGGKRVEDFLEIKNHFKARSFGMIISSIYLHSLVQFPDVLDCQACVVDLQRAWQVGLAQVPHRPVLEVQVFERALQGCQVGGPGGDGQGSQVVDFVLDKVLLQGDVLDATGFGGRGPRRHCKNIQFCTIYSTLNLSCNESFSSEFVPPNFS